MSSKQPPPPINLRVTYESRQGNRSHMEDRFVAYEYPLDENGLEYTYFGVFDGHGGREAAEYARNHLLTHIVSQDYFSSNEDALILRAIRKGFLSCHRAMWKERIDWHRKRPDILSSAGTTASVVFLLKNRLFVGHVGDSGIVLGMEDEVSGTWTAKLLTAEHKPDNLGELARIQDCGGSVRIRHSTPRVVWKQSFNGYDIQRPFLAVSRSLGDFWSYNPDNDEFIVSPEPETRVIKINASFRCLILGSDGLWDVVPPQDAVDRVRYIHLSNTNQLPGRNYDILEEEWKNPSTTLVEEAFLRWFMKNTGADNTTAVTVMIEPGEPPAKLIVPKTEDPDKGPSPIKSLEAALTEEKPAVSDANGNGHVNPIINFQPVIRMRKLNTDEIRSLLFQNGINNGTAPPSTRFLRKRKINGSEEVHHSSTTQVATSCPVRATPAQEELSSPNGVADTRDNEDANEPSAATTRRSPRRGGRRSSARAAKSGTSTDKLLEEAVKKLSTLKRKVSLRNGAGIPSTPSRRKESVGMNGVAESESHGDAVRRKSLRLRKRDVEDRQWTIKQIRSKSKVTPKTRRCSSSKPASITRK